MVSYFTLVVLAAASTLFSLTSFFIYLFTPPRNFPKNIPTIPFYYALFPLFRDGDQAELYREYLKEPLEKYGAVKIFFGGRWNILVRRPAFVAEVFKREDVYAKSGNQVKIPHSVLAEYTGDNIISAHGANWKLYTSIIKPALQRDQDPSSVWRNSKQLVGMLLSSSKSESKSSPDGAGIQVYGLLQRFTLANLSETLFGTTFETMQRTDSPLNAFQAKIKPIIFNPIFLNFPFLDHLPLKSRQIGRELARGFRSKLRKTVSDGHEKHTCASDSQELGCRLLSAHRDGVLSSKQLDDNLVSTFLAGHENPQLSILSLLYLLGENTEIQQRVREEINTLFPSADSTEKDDDFEPAYSAIHDLPLLTATIYEALRLFPPISQLINRRTTSPVFLPDSNILIPAGTYIGYNAYSTNRDTDFWGADADSFKPERWGNSMSEIQALYRKANSKGAFISFHGGRRACLGQKFAMQELRIAMVEVLRGGRWTVKGDGEEGAVRMTPAGPLYPRGLKLVFERLEKVKA